MVRYPSGWVLSFTVHPGIGRAVQVEKGKLVQSLGPESCPLVQVSFIMFVGSEHLRPVEESTTFNL
jgi:hypothetical protein